MSKKKPQGREYGPITKKCASFFAGVALAIGIVVVIIVLMGEGVGMTPDSGGLVVVLACIGLTIGFKISEGMKKSIETFLLPVGFFASLTAAVTYLSYSQLGSNIFYGVYAFGAFFLFSSLLVYSDQVEKMDSLEKFVRFTSDRLSWGLVGYYIVSAFLKPALALILSEWSSGTLNPTIASMALVLGVLTIGMFGITLGVFSEDSYLRSHIPRFRSSKQAPGA